MFRSIDKLITSSIVGSHVRKHRLCWTARLYYLDVGYANDCILEALHGDMYRAMTINVIYVYTLMQKNSDHVEFPAVNIITHVT
jgi:hypothetical protein